MFKRKQNLPWVGLSLMTDPHFFTATRPLFEQGEVEVLEWSFDAGWEDTIPSWASELIDFYSQRDRLLGHGVTYSLLSAEWSDRQMRWLKQFQAECSRHRYVHISEHFGWMSAGNFARSAPLPMPYTPDAVSLGRDRLQRLADAAKVPVGLENLAFAFGQKDVADQGKFITELLEPVDGFLLLDLHNLFCQIHNFQLSIPELLASYPLARVRELHLSGGSWSRTTPDSNLVRRDTHDGAVPEAVFDLLAIVLKQCTNVKAVILERLGHTLNSEPEIEQFRQDFNRIKQIVKRCG
ncbi:DUF692 family protein [Cyanobacteria bacterium FACHB-471]|nr:DUF692 family protein [Cyanobacteria bacterium FACHB-471]